jgi:hypothetical protein
MMMRKETELPGIIKAISNESSSIRNKKITLGFDAFVDHLVKIIRHKEDNASPTYFESSLEFGQYILDKGGKNFSVEVQEIASKIGGNMPITANAFAQSIPGVNCIGPFGYPTIDPTFRELSNQCNLFSFGNPGLSKLLEFKTGKMMLAQSGQLQLITWENIRDLVGKDLLVSLFAGADLVVLLNWGELDYSTAVWKGLLNEVLIPAGAGKKPLGFFDLSDCSNRTHEQVKEALDLIKQFAQYWDVIFSLNLNEAAIVYDVLTSQTAADKNFGDIAQEIFETLGIDTVLIHHAKNAIAASKKGLEERNSFFLEAPLISTGAGDNFNAGFCIGRLMDLDNGASLVLGNATASLYMRSGVSPGLDEIKTFLQEDLYNLL